MDDTPITPASIPPEYKPLPIGIRAENKVNQIMFDFSAWAEKYGAGVVQLLVKRPGDAAAYPVELEQSGTTATWTISSTDIAKNGLVRAEYVYTVGQAVKKSTVGYYYVYEDIGGTGDPPDPYEDWLDQLTALAAETQQAAIDAEAASEAVQGMGVEAEALQPGATPTVTKSVDPETGAVTLVFGLPSGGGGGGGTVESVNGKTGEVTLTASDVGALADDGDGSNVTVDYSAVQTREAIATGEKLSVLFGKVLKWLSDLGTAAFRAATATLEAGSTALIEAGAVYTALASKYVKPSDGIPESDLANAVQTSLGKADTALPKTGGTMSGAIAMGSNKITGLANGTDAGDAVNKGQLDAAALGALKPSGSVAFASLPSLAAANLNKVYNVTDGFTTTSDFVEGAGKSYPAGTNVAIVNTGTDESPVYKYDVYGSFVDLSAYRTATAQDIIDAGKLGTSGDGSNVTVAFSAAGSRTAIATGEKLSVLFGKVLKWLSDLGTAAFRAATATLEAGSTALIESGAVHTALGNKQDSLAQKQLVWYGVCDTAAATQEKTVAIDGITALTDGLCIRVKFTNRQYYSGATTLKVNNLAAANIRRLSGINATRYEWQDGEVIDLVYMTISDVGYWVIVDGGIASTTYYGMVRLLTSATSTSEAYALTPKSLNSLVQSMIADYDVYSSSATYAVGDRVRYNYKLWQCSTAITTAESWTDAHWTAISPLIDLTEARQAKVTASGLLKGDGNGGVTAATAGTDYEAAPTVVTQSAPTAITLADNTVYYLSDVASLTLTYPASGHWACLIVLTTAASGTVTVTLPTSSFIGSAPEIGNGETWELSFRDGVVVAGKCEAAT